MQIAARMKASRCPPLLETIGNPGFSSCWSPTLSRLPARQISERRVSVRQAAATGNSRAQPWRDSKPRDYLDGCGHDFAINDTRRPARNAAHRRTKLAVVRYVFD